MVDVRRGGKVTYHGPGQMVAYPIVHVGDVLAFVRLVERAAVAAIATHGVQARGRADEGRDFTGVWVEERKIGSIGLHVAGQVTTHGLAVNVDNDLEPFSWVVPCGLPEVEMTSLACEGASRASVERVWRELRGRVRFRARGRGSPGGAGRARAGLLDPSHPLGWDSMAEQTQREHKTRSRANPGGMDVLEVLGPDVQSVRGRKPPWFKVPAPGGRRYEELNAAIKGANLNTVCQEAACPNVGECWERGTATFMILGDTCTRRCGFCNVKTGKPTWNDPLEPARVARQVAMMGLRHAVITSVDRDDLPDKGAGVWVGTIRQLRSQAPNCKVEVLTPDFQGQEMPLAKVIDARPDVFNHNVEVVPRLYSIARRGSRWPRSLRVLRNAKAMGGAEVVTKSGLMVGLGETREEVLDALGQLREHGVQVITIGQYLRPTERHLPVVRYWHPDEFDELRATRA